jgi:hypothetical protein
MGSWRSLLETPCHYRDADAVIETSLELDMLKPLELGTLELVVENEDPDDTREHHSQFAQLPPKVSAQGCEFLIRVHLSRAQKGTPAVIDRTHPTAYDDGMAENAKISEMAARTSRTTRANERTSS